MTNLNTGSIQTLISPSTEYYSLNFGSTVVAHALSTDVYVGHPYFTLDGAIAYNTGAYGCAASADKLHYLMLALLRCFRRLCAQVLCMCTMRAPASTCIGTRSMGICQAISNSVYLCARMGVACM